MRNSHSPTIAIAGLGAAFATGALAAEPGRIADLVAQSAPAVATIMVEREVEAPLARMAPSLGDMPMERFMDLFRNFDPDARAPEKAMRRALGAGFVIDAAGYLITNEHLVADAERITVAFEHLGEFDAELVGVDEHSDLALLKIDAQDLPVLPLGDSEALRVGDEVIAVGNPFGLGGTVTSGIVSALEREIDDHFVEFIQTDAAINHGNSGGPLMNLDGEVIGVTSAIYSPDGGSVGLGFAIPSDLVENVAAQLRENGEVAHGWLGVRIQTVTPAIAEALGMDAARGALVADTAPGGPAERILRAGDVILSFAGEDVKSSRSLPRLVAAAPQGEAVRIELLRDGERRALEVTLGARPDESGPIAAARVNADAVDALGATLAGLTPQARRELDQDEDQTGALITSLKRGGAADRAGLKVGDIVTGIDGEPVENPDDLARAIASAGDAAVLLRINRADASLYVGMRPG